MKVDENVVEAACVAYHPERWAEAAESSKAIMRRWMADALNAALPLLTPQPQVVDGFVLVPREPTDAMLQAMHTGQWNAVPDGVAGGHGKTISAKAIYRAQYAAMLAAHQPAAQAKGDGS